ncbi:ABC1 kinase family protein [Nanoarchaeota archaeon]
MNVRFWPSHDESVRLRQIARVLWEHHLGHYIKSLGLHKKVPFEKRILGDRYKETQLTPAVVLKIIEDLDGSFIKLGQLLSLRPDLIPAEYCEELSKLQDEVSAFSGKKAKAIVEKELGKPIGRVFSQFNLEPIAAASMGQVHLAKLKDGTKVAVKVQRPGVQKTVKVDIKLLFRLAGVVKKRFGTAVLDPIEIVREFERYTENELNYLKEAHNIDLFYNQFSKSKTILVPKVFWSQTTSRVLTMEYIPGKRLTDMSKFAPAQRKRIISTILDAEFHADPHPGNFLVKRNGKVALLDFGIVGRLNFVMKEHITDYFIALVNADVDAMVEAAMKLGVATEDTDIDKVKRDIYDQLSLYYGTSLDKMNVSDALHAVLRIFRENKLKASPDFVLLTKATVTLESVALKLDPKMNFVKMARPFVRKIARQRLHPKKIAERARRKVETMIAFAESVPQRTTAMMSDLHNTSRDLRRIDGDINMLAVEMDRSSNRLTLGFLAGTLFLASTIMLPFQKVPQFGLPILSSIGYIIALVVTVSILVSMLKEKKI